MFCPKCGEEQAASDVSFCVRCGFMLDDVSEAILNEGRVERKVIQSSKELRSATMKGVSVMTLGGVFLLISLILGTPEPSYFVQFNLLVGILAFLFGIGLIAYNFWLKPKSLEGRDDAKRVRSIGHEDSDAKVLNEPDLSNLADYAAPRNQLSTNDLAEPASVVESTTRKLKQRRIDD